MYGRNSVDPRKKGSSVADQLSNGRALADKHNWPVKKEFKDTGISAGRGARRKRDDFEELIRRIRLREARIVVAFEASRYYRDLEFYVQIRNACMDAGVLLCYDGTVYDLSKREDRKATAMDAVAAEDELSGIRLRNLRTVNRNAAKGGPHGPAPYGYRRVYDPDTGDLVDQVSDGKRGKYVVEIYERYRSGMSKRRLALMMNERGEVSRLGKPWDYRSISVLLRNPAYIGIRSHKGVETPGTWKGIVPKKLYWEVQEMLAAETRGPMEPGDRESKWWLSLRPICAVHEGAIDPAMARFRRTTTNRRRPVYACQSKDLSINAELLEAYVESGMLEWLMSKEAAAVFMQPSDPAAADKATTRLTGIRRQLDEARRAATRFSEDGEPELSALSLAALEKSLLPQLRQAELAVEAATVSAPDLVRDLVGNPLAPQVWESLDVRQRRFVVDHVVTVRIFKARAPGVKRIEPGRVTLTFYGQEGFVPRRRRR